VLPSDVPDLEEVLPLLDGAPGAEEEAADGNALLSTRDGSLVTVCPSRKSLLENAGGAQARAAARAAMKMGAIQVPAVFMVTPLEYWW
jgi:hypothetical protein